MTVKGRPVTIRAMEKWQIIIIGGGASGLVAAGAASEAGAPVLVCEKMNKVARKVGISGKGRGNITNDKPLEIFGEGYRHGGDFLRSAFARFFVADTIGLLEKRGVACVTERGGRVFPASGKAQDAVKALYRYARANGAAVRTETAIAEIARNENGFALRVGEQWLQAKRVILATGGKSYPATGSTGDGYRFAAALGHNVIEPRPALAPIRLTGLPPELRMHLKNVGVALLDGKVQIAAGFGEALLENGEAGGPVPLNLARQVTGCAQPTLAIDLKPALDEAKLDARLRRDLEAGGKAPLADVLRGLLPQALIPLIVMRAELNAEQRCAEISKKTRARLHRTLKRLTFPVTGIGDWRQALVTAGGVNLDEVDPRTMESKLVPGLYLCGEVLDIDGISGGYNLQAAFSTGYLAGRAAAKALS